MDLVILVIAGLLECFWATFMKLSEGFTKPGYTVITIIGMIASMALLAHATKTLPLGTAYAIWTGIGAVGSVVVGILLFREPATAARILFASLIVVGLVGLKLTAGEA